MQAEKSNGNELLESAAKGSVDNEFYTPIPKGYVTGKTKYVVIFGTVMSGLGKGIFSSSLAKLLQLNGLTVAPIKFDGYLNFDAGTLNPFRHGETFVLDDGLECDMDLGTYERFLNLDLNKDNYLTGGKIFQRVLGKEREGKYLGKDVQFIPHVTGEIKYFLRKLGMKRSADIVFIEVGGTVGDIENAYFIEAMRELAYEEGRENVCNIALTMILEPKFLGEQKSKAAQLGLKQLSIQGIHPDIVACRSHNKITESVREKISVYSSVPVQNVVGVHDCETIYSIPELLHDEKIDKIVLSKLGFQAKPPQFKEGFNEWQEYLKKFNDRKKELTIGITGKYTGLRDSYASIIHALEHAGTTQGAKINIKWIETTAIEEGKKTVEEELGDVDGIIVPGGFGKRGVEGKIKCVQYVREKKIPYLGLCYGFQMALIEFARNVCNLKDAHTTEVEPETKTPVIDILPEQKDVKEMGASMRLGGHDMIIKEGTIAHKLFGDTKTRMRFRHRYECNPEYIKTFEENGIVFSAHPEGQDIMQILELPNHPFFVGTQAHPEFGSRPLVPHPLYRGFIEACLKEK